MTERDRLFLEHIAEAIGRIERFTVEGRLAFMADEKTQSAVMRQLEIIGEAAKRISGPMKESAADIPWREISATRDRLIHGYFSVKLEIVWNVIERDLVGLKQRVADLLAGGR